MGSSPRSGPFGTWSALDLDPMGGPGCLLPARRQCSLDFELRTRIRSDDERTEGRSRRDLGSPSALRPGTRGVSGQAAGTSGAPLRLTVAAEIRLYREGLAVALGAEQALDVAGTASTAEEALTLARELHPDVALVDVS